MANDCNIRDCPVALTSLTSLFQTPKPTSEIITGRSPPTTGAAPPTSLRDRTCSQVRTESVCSTCEAAAGCHLTNGVSAVASASRWEERRAASRPPVPAPVSLPQPGTAGAGLGQPLCRRGLMGPSGVNICRRVLRVSTGGSTVVHRL